MLIKEATYERVALEDPTGGWELACGRLRRKPGMTFAHSHVLQTLNQSLVLQLHDQEYAISVNHTRLRISTGAYYIPDLCVIPRDLERQKLGESPNRLEVYDEPMPLVVEVWSPSTGDYDVEEKLREYQQRGDLEIWRLHPIERTLMAWRLQPGGGYEQALYRGGTVQPAALPAVTIELERLFT